MKLKVKQIREENQSCSSFVLQKPVGFSFYTGQYLDISLKGDTRAFTISSSPTENYLMITPKKGTSDFKKNLFSLKAEDNIDASHPAGTFILDETSPAIFIAGGVGITPFRSMIKYAIDQKISTPITLIYSNSDNNFLFKKELDAWKKEYPKLTISYHNTSQFGHLNLDSKFLILDSIYYLAGPPGFVDNMAKILLEAGVDETNIRYDRFDGY